MATGEYFLCCARGGDRTRMTFRSRNFKSRVYTNSTTRATSLFLAHFKATAGILSGRSLTLAPPSRASRCSPFAPLKLAHRSGVRFPTKRAQARFSVRPRRESHPRIEVLQTPAFLLRHVAVVSLDTCSFGVINPRRNATRFSQRCHVANKSKDTLFIQRAQSCHR